MVAPGTDRGVLHHQDELVGLLLFGNDGLQRGKLLLQRIHFRLQFSAALLIDPQALNLGFERGFISACAVYNCVRTVLRGEAAGT